jgi:hypothetical protein
MPSKTLKFQLSGKNKKIEKINNKKKRAKAKKKKQIYSLAN